MSNNAHDLSNRLLNALDNNYNVVDMHAVNEIISILEKINITKELLETTRLGKHVNELRRKTSDPTLARRAKVLVKRWRDLVIPTVASPAHTGSNRSSAERSVRRLGGTPLTSPALSRQVVSPAVSSPRPPSRPTWGGYESDSQDVILVDDDPPAHQLAPLKPLTPPVKRPQSPAPAHDDKKVKRDKKPKKRRGYSRAGSGAEAAAGAAEAAPAPPAPPAAAPAPAHAPAAWGARNGSSHSERRRNGYRRDAVDPYAALVNRMPPAGAKKVKTTKELLEEIQSRKVGKPAASPTPPGSPDVMLIEPDSCPVKVESPLRNGSGESRAASPPPAAPPLPPLEDEREYFECTCGSDEEDPGCAAGGARAGPVLPLHVRALHNALLPGVNGTRAPLHPHRFAVRPPTHPDRPDLFASVVPLYKYSDYADDYCAKNMDSVPLCMHLPWTEFAPSPPSPPRPPSPPPPRPYPLDDLVEPVEAAEPRDSPSREAKLETEPVGAMPPELSDRLKVPPPELDAAPRPGAQPMDATHVPREFQSDAPDHRTVERTKAEPPPAPDGRALYELCASARRAVRYDYSQLVAAPTVSLGAGAGADEAGAALRAALERAAADTPRDALGRPARPQLFAEWHECARLGDLVALPYVVID